MSYSGNPSLAQDVQERISNTFQQTLDLVVGERHQEALVGCEFILRMDPEFRPAQTLVARLKSGAKPVSVDDLRTQDIETELGDLADLDDLGSLDDLEDLGGLDDLDFDEDLAAAASTPPAPSPLPAVGSGLGAVVSDLLARRNFGQILQIAETQKPSIDRDPEVEAMVEKARSLLESDAYVQAFLGSARQARAEGRLEEVASHLKKARALDPEHPDLLGFAAERARADVSDDDLIALQQQSLSLESGEDDAEPESELFADLAHDPRQTKPMAAIPQVDQAEPAGGETAETAAEAEDLFDAEGEAGEPSEVVADFDEQDFGEEQTWAPEDREDVSLDSPREDEAAELTLDDQDAPEVAEPADGGNRVVELLAKGQGAFDQGEFQAAIDVWSRIFLIEIDNGEASSRIEEARSKKAELERRAEELFHEAVGQLDSDSIEEARSTLARVLELAPGYALAREYLDQLDAGQRPVTGGSDLDVSLEAEPTPDLGTKAGMGTGSASLEAAVARDRIVLVKKTDKRFIALGAVVLLAVLGSGAFLFSKWDDWFPNQETPPTMAQARKVDPIERATKMHEGGNTENAILLLERIQPQDPIYEDAQALIAQWRALVESPPEPEAAGPTAEQLVRHELLIRAAREAHKQGRHLRARKYFDLASKIMPLEAEDQALKSEGDLRLESLAGELTLFDQGQYTAILPVLWRKRDADPGNLDIERLIIDSYYNLALTDLQRGNPQDAAKKLAEALEVQPDNDELRRLHLFANTYVQRPQDLLFRIFVKYLPSH